MPTTLTVHPGKSSKTAVQFPHLHNLFEDMERLTDRISKRAFSLFQQRGGGEGRDWDDWLKAESEVLKAVPVEIVESDQSFSIRAEVPGFKAEELTVQVESNGVYIRGRSESRNEEKGKGVVTYSEVFSNEIARHIELPAIIDASKSEAKLSDGVLELTLPKSASPKAIDSKVA